MLSSRVEPSPPANLWDMRNTTNTVGLDPFATTSTPTASGEGARASDQTQTASRILNSKARLRLARKRLRLQQVTDSAANATQNGLRFLQVAVELSRTLRVLQDTQAAGARQHQKPTLAAEPSRALLKKALPHWQPSPPMPPSTLGSGHSHHFVFMTCLGFGGV
jgi:hypothetical protein